MPEIGARGKLSLVIPSSPQATLILIPTRLEQWGLRRVAALCRSELCGFGAVMAAARATQLLAQQRPRRVLLVGIAGTFDPHRLPVGSATTFRTAALDGVGAGSGEMFLSASTLGFPLWEEGTGGRKIGETLPLAINDACPTASLLVTGCAASASPAEAQWRRRRFPDAAAEDMEAFGVALACRLAQVPLAVVRGISNVVGDRNTRAWQIQPAITAASELAGQMLDATWEEPR